MPERSSHDPVNAEIGIVPGFFGRTAASAPATPERIGSVSTGTQEPFADVVRPAVNRQFVCVDFAFDGLCISIPALSTDILPRWLRIPPQRAQPQPPNPPNSSPRSLPRPRTMANERQRQMVGHRREQNEIDTYRLLGMVIHASSWDRAMSSPYAYTI